ncbi:MAG: FumA C-terminus/TtdB family hydratase beta subunit [Coprothermobacterota bacterium]|nr:FumA C-terminus/TtdB family hydratase beta subunit [Coprothermobacterota bacterium]
MKTTSLHTPLTEADLLPLQAGDRVLLNGRLYTARDIAHQRLAAVLAQGFPPPFPLEGSVIYYCGPSPAPPGQVIGSAGPTTASRMDPYTSALLAAGVRATIGKGPRSPAVQQAMAQYRAIYLAATGGAGALLAQTIITVELVAYPELGPEAIYCLQVVDFPAIVAIDLAGRDLYQEVRQQTVCGGAEC